jgi:hypothetical protein
MMRGASLVTGIKPWLMRPFEHRHESGESLDLLHIQLQSDHQRLIGILADSFQSEGRWPEWRWVRKQLATPGSDAIEILQTLPHLGGRVNGSGLVYGLVWFSDSDLLRVLRDDVVLGLTTIGLWRAGLTTMVRLTLDQLTAMVAASRNFQPSPRGDDRQPELLLPEAFGVSRRVGDGEDIDRLRHEPPFMRSSISSSDAGRWRLCFNDEVERYSDVDDIESYYAQVARDIRKVNEGLGNGLSVPTLSSPQARPPIWRRVSIWVTVTVAGAVGSIIDDSVRGLLRRGGIWIWRLISGG